MVIKSPVFDLILSTLLVLLLSACASLTQKSSPRIKISAAVSVSLPSPRELGYSLTATQLIRASWADKQRMQTEQLPVRLQVNANEIIMAGFSPWGTRVLSLKYQDKLITTDVLAGLKNTLPKPEQVLFNLMIALWPGSAWEEPLKSIGWKLNDSKGSRTVVDKNGKKVIDIEYGADNKLDAEIIFHNIKHNYTIIIDTLQYQVSTLL